MADQTNEISLADVPHDVLTLPSRGLYYPTKKAQVKVAYLNASDENVLTSMNLMENGEMFNILLDRKVLERDLRPSQMLDGDRVAILFFLRATGYGAEFPLTVIDPLTKKPFEWIVDLSKIAVKEDLLEPDERGEMPFFLPHSNKNCKFKFLSGGENNQIIKNDEDRMAKLGQNAFSEIVTARLTAQIQEIDGIRDKGEIAKFVRAMSVKDSSVLRKYITDKEPGLDLKTEVVAPSGARFHTGITISSQFFWPYL